MLVMYLIVGNFKAVQEIHESFCFLSLWEVAKASSTVFFPKVYLQSHQYILIASF